MPREFVSGRFHRSPGGACRFDVPGHPPVPVNRCTGRSYLKPLSLGRRSRGGVVGPNLSCRWTQPAIHDESPQLRTIRIMTSSTYHLVVGGHPELADILTASGAFAGVIPVASTGALRDAIGSGAFPKEQDQTCFVFADSMPVDTDQDLEYLAGGMTRAGYKVLLLSMNGSSVEMAQRNPTLAVFDGTFTLNSVLGAISGLGLGVINPHPEGHKPLFETDSAPTAPAAPEETIEPFFDAEPAPAPTTEPSFGGGWQTVSADDAAAPAAPAATSPAIPQAAPAPAASGPFAKPAEAGPANGPAAGGFARPAFARPGGETGGAEPGREGFGTGQLDGGIPKSHTVNQGLIRPDTGIHAPAVGTHQDFAPRSTGRPLGHVITVTSPKGGTGKSTVSLNAAVYLGMHLRGTGRRVCLIDANFQQADTGKILCQYSPSISNLLRDQASIVPERIEEYLVHRPEWNTSFLLGPATPRDASPMHYNSELYSRILDVLRTRFDYIVIDTPVAEVFHDILRGFALPEADFIVVPIVPAIHTLMNADGWLSTITLPRHSGGDGIDPERIGVMLNQAQEGVDCDEDEVRRELYSWRFIGSIPQTKEWLRCVNAGELIATKNYAEVNTALDNILFAATGLESLLHGYDDAVDHSGGGGGFFDRFFRGRR